MANIVYRNGNSGDITIPATESIAVYAKGTAKVYRKTGYPNYPESLALLGTVTDEETVFGSYSSGATIIVESQDGEVWYEVGAAPVVRALRVAPVQSTPVAVNTTGSVSATAILGGIVTSTTAAAVAGTIPTGTVMDAAAEFAVNDSIDWSVINTGGANAFTVTAATGHTIVGAAAVANSTSGLFRTRKTAANTFVTYRIG